MGHDRAEHIAHKSSYWEGQEGTFGPARAPIFGSRNYPDFIITRPYLIAIEYKQGPNGSLVKHALGQSAIHTMGNQFDYVYCLFHDESKNKRIEAAASHDLEASILDRMWREFNVMLRFV